jgi:hypothetical protein
MRASPPVLDAHFQHPRLYIGRSFGFDSSLVPHTSSLCPITSRISRKTPPPVRQPAPISEGLSLLFCTLHFRGGFFPQLPPPPPIVRRQSRELVADCITASFALDCVFCTLYSGLWRYLFSKTIPWRGKHAGLLCFGGTLSSIRRAVAQVVQRRMLRAFPPRSRQLGGDSRASRRFCATNFATTVAVPVLPAVKFGG